PLELTDYLRFDDDGVSTTIHISSSGGFSGAFDSGVVDQTIVLDSVLLAGVDDTAIITGLLDAGKLITD
ncbi:MAG: type I secretion C-terminal target domain-containing protein, partial [Pseudomonadales bacterium]